MCVFIFLYFVSLSPFILDLLCLLDCGFLCLSLYSCILYLDHHLFQISCVLWTVGSQCVCLNSCILYLYQFLFQISCVLGTVRSYVCVYSLVFCTFITFYFRSLVSCVLWVPLFVFVYLYFVSLSPFILDLLCLVDCGFLCLCLYSCILYLDHLLFQISCVLCTVGSSVCVYILVFCIQITFYFRSLVSCVLWVPLFVFIFLYFVYRSPFILDLLCLVDCGLLCLCLYSCILYLDHLLFQISCVLGTVGSSVCVCILVFCTFITFYFRSLVSCGLWVPLFVFIFLYFVSRSPFILDLLCLVDCGFLCLCLYSCILYLYHLLFQISCVLWTVGSSVCVYILVFCIQITFYFRSLVSCGLWVPLFVFIFLYFVSRSPFILDLLCLVYCGFLCLCLYSCILYLYHLLFQISCVLWTVGSSVCVYILVFCIQITFYFRSLVSCVLWVPLFVFIFLYFVSRSPFILDLLCLVDCGFLCLCLYSCILYLDHLLFQISCVLWTVGSSVCVYILVFCIFITFYFRSLVSCGLWVPLFVFIFLYFVSLSPFILDLLCLVDCGFLCLCLYSCILYLDHLLFQISCVLWTVGSSVCVYILVFCIFITFYFRSLVSCVLWVPLFVFIFLYFVSLSPFILDLLCLVDCGFLCLCLYSCILYLYHLLFQISCVLWTVGSSVCVYILVFCIQITFYFRSLVSCGLWVPLFVFIFLYFVSRSPFILDLLCLVDCGFLCLCLYSCILYLYHLLFQISCVLWTVGSSVCVYILVFCIQITFYFRSLVSCGLWVPLFVFIFLYFVSRSPFILDLLCLVYCGFLCLCLYSCILYLYHLLFQISCVLWTVGSSVCVYILVFCIQITFYFRSLVSCGLWVPLFVFIFLYFVSRSPFILDLLCLVYCGFLCLCLYSCILYLDHLLFQISCVLWTVGSSVCVYILVFCIFITFYFRSLVSCGLWVPLFVFIFLYFVSRSPFILDLLCLVYCGFLCLCLYSCILYLYHLLFQISCVLGTVGSSVCVYILVFCIFITFYFRSLVSCGTVGSYVCVYILVFCIQITFYFRSLVSCVLWVPLFVFIFLYFVSLSPFILDLLCLVYCGFLCLCLYSCILYLYHLLFQISCVLCTVGSSVCVYILVFCIFITFYFRSLVSCVLWVPLFVFIFLYFVSRSPFILDLLCLVYCGFLCLCLYSCILYLYHLLFQISCVLCTVGSNPQSTRQKRSKIKGGHETKFKNTNTNRGTHSTQETRYLK